MKSLLLAIVAAAALVAPAISRAADARSTPTRAAIVVGASAPVPGRALLRYAYQDAEAIADVLVTVGGFARDRVHVLRDPEPAALIALVDREAASLAGAPHGLLFFYYSGHADQRALYTAGKPVAVEALRRALDRSDVSLRVGVIDACQGGGWTRAKGLVSDEAFEVRLPPVLASEGSALIASSSGAESAHESDALGGSFFTHHFAAALRGAADQRRDGAVTLVEAFEYAREQTIRDTARHAPEPQHPSFALNLTGRQDVVLAQVSASPSALAVEQTDGPIEIVHLGSGLRMIELPPGRRTVVLAVPPGRYLVRTLGTDGVHAREIVVPPEGETTISEHELVLVASERLAVKDGPGWTIAPPWPARGGGEMEIGFETWRDAAGGYGAIGTGDDAGVGAMLRFDGRLGITDRLAWKIGTLAVAYRLGERDGVEIVPYAGVLSWKLAPDEASVPNLGGFLRGDSEARIGAGLGTRIPFAGGAVVLTTGVERVTIGDQTGSRLTGGAGVTVGLGSAVTVHLSAGFIRSELPGLTVTTSDGTGTRVQGFGGRSREVYFGSLQEFGLASLPLVRVTPASGWSVDFYASGTEYRRVSYRLGVARAF